MYLLDTSIVSLFDPRRRAEAGPVLDWMRRHDPLLFLSTVTLTEIEAGILKLAREEEHARATQIAQLRDGLIADFANRLLPMDVAVARLAEAVRPMVIERADFTIAATGLNPLWSPHFSGCPQKLHCPPVLHEVLIWTIKWSIL